MRVGGWIQTASVRGRLGREGEGGRVGGGAGRGVARQGDYCGEGKDWGVGDFDKPLLHGVWHTELHPCKEKYSIYYILYYC